MVIDESHMSPVLKIEDKKIEEKKIEEKKQEIKLTKIESPQKPEIKKTSE